MRKNRYRLMGLLAVIVLFYIFVFIVDFKDIGKMAAGLFKEHMIQSAMPASFFLGNVEDNHEFNIKNTVINDIYPMNEYLLSNESMCGTKYMSNSTDDSTLDSPEKNKTQNGDGSDADKDAESNAAQAESNAVQPENNPPAEQNSEAGTQVISRNVRTGTIFNRSDLNNYDFVFKKFYTVTGITSLTPQILRPQEFLDKNMQITHDASSPQILIFHTHSQETFKDSVPGDPNTSIVGVGDYLTELLTKKYGYNVIHDKSVYDYVDGKLDRSKAYTYSEAGIKKILDENPSIEVVIDLHRDGVAETTHLTTQIDGKQMSKVMLFNGLSYSNVKGDIDYLYNPYRDDNLAMSLQMQLLGEAYYPGFLRRIYCNAYRYCLHERAKSMLIEAGAQTNTFQEEINAMEPLSDLLDKLLKGEHAY